MKIEGVFPYKRFFDLNISLTLNLTCMRGKKANIDLNYLQPFIQSLKTAQRVIDTLIQNVKNKTPTLLRRF